MKLKAAFPLINYGIFDFLLDMPFSAIVDTITLNNTLYFTHGGKCVSPALCYFMSDPQPGIDGLHSVSDDGAETLALMIKARYYEKWKRYAAMLEYEYNPIENYNMVERGVDSGSSTEKKDETNTRNVTGNTANTTQMDASRARNNIQSGENASNTTSDTSRAQDSVQTSESTGESDVYGFNSTGAVPSNASSADGKLVNSASDLSREALHSDASDKTVGAESELNRANNKTLSSSSGTELDNLQSNNTRLNDTLHNLTRSGNIGVTTTQQMLNQERDFWTWSYIKEVVHDVAEFLTLSVY